MPEAESDELEAGDIVWIDFGLPLGHEQAGRRPALVVSPQEYSHRSALIIVCPITRNMNPWGFKVATPLIGRLQGAILADQIRSIDPHARFVRRRGERVPPEVLAEVYGILAGLFGIPVVG
ncbi:MAG TPA: type II toxin-antitoxin system PemK/MazF family toxin [Beijerinckiaceae bacterium]|jgi:mRNA interferase MazF|nr:type II toxin-antitoxin system PemK/MazF family toxin [Beijerinckiaceae bacterium]